MSAPRPTASAVPSLPPGTEACGCCEGIEPATPQRIDNRRACPPSPTASAPRAVPRQPARAAVVAGRRAAARAAHARRRRLHDRPDRRVRLRGRRAHLLPGAHRQRVLPAHRDRARVAAGDGAAHRLPAAPRRGGRDLARVHARDAARAAAGADARARRVRHRRADDAARSARASQVQSVPGPDEKPQTFETVEGHRGAPAVERDAPVAEPRRAAPGCTARGHLARRRAHTSSSPATRCCSSATSSSHDDEQRQLGLPPPRPRASSTPTNDRTHVSWKRGLGSLDAVLEPERAQPQVHVLRKRAAVFGHNAPMWKMT